MKILEYTGLDISGVKASYQKVSEAIDRDDFRSAQVRKLVNLTHGKFFRARLDAANRLLFTLVRSEELCAVMLEVITSHNARIPARRERNLQKHEPLMREQYDLKF